MQRAHGYCLQLHSPVSAQTTGILDQEPRSLSIPSRKDLALAIEALDSFWVYFRHMDLFERAAQEEATESHTLRHGITVVLTGCRTRWSLTVYDTHACLEQKVGDLRPLIFSERYRNSLP